MKHFFAAILCLSATACGPYERPDPVYDSRAVNETLVGDFDDVRAAVRAAARDVDMVIVDEALCDEVQEFMLRCRNDEPANLTAKKRDGGVELTASVGRFGDAAMQRDLIIRVKRRLESLRGRDSAPLRGYP